MRRALFAALFLAATTMSFADNPVIKTQYSADPTARVMNDKLFVFPSTDVPPVEGYKQSNFFMPYYHVFSSENLVDWQDHGRQIDQVDVPWAINDAYAMWAPDCIERDGKFYFYFPTKPKEAGKGGFNTGVAIADNPEGPYKIQKSQIPGIKGIDPNVFIDDDGSAYLYWGSGETIQGAKLKDNMVEIDGKQVDLQGLPPKYKEAAFMFKRNGIYYMTYSHETPERNCELSYSTSTSPLGEFTYRGPFMKRWSDLWTNHHSFVEYRGDWILFYHHIDISGKRKMRSICADYVTFSADGRINLVHPTYRGIGVCSAESMIQLDRYSDISEKGASIAKIGAEFPANWHIEGAQNKGWVRYNKVLFDANKSYKKIKVRCQTTTAGSEKRMFEIRENGSFGKVIASVEIPDTKGEYVNVEAKLKYSPKGEIDLCAMFVGGKGELYNIDWVQFE